MRNIYTHVIAEGILFVKIGTVFIKIDNYQY